MRSRMPSSVRAPKITIGTNTRSNTLRSTIPIPSSNAVTTAQIVRTTKRGENGSNNVSMESLRQHLAVLFLSGAAYSNNQNNPVHDIRRKARGYDSPIAARLPNSVAQNQSAV